MLVSQFLESTIAPFDLGAFFSRYVIKDNSIVSVSSYRHHKDNYVSNDEYNESLDKYENILNACSYHNLWCRKTSTNFVITLENDLRLNNEQFFARLLQKIFLAPFFMDKDLSENKKMFLRGFFETRGSIDTTLSFL